jgi:hypothetical protein
MYHQNLIATQTFGYNTVFLIRMNLEHTREENAGSDLKSCDKRFSILWRDCCPDFLPGSSQRKDRIQNYDVFSKVSFVSFGL